MKILLENLGARKRAVVRPAEAVKRGAEHGRVVDSGAHLGVRGRGRI